jgi:hypothetical protein
MGIGIGGDYPLSAIITSEYVDISYVSYGFYKFLLFRGEPRQREVQDGLGHWERREHHLYGTVSWRYVFVITDSI